MTEAQWLVSADVESLIGSLVEKRFPKAEPCNWGHGERKKRLFLAACLRRIWHALPKEYRTLVETLEADADEYNTIGATERQNNWSAAEIISWPYGDLPFALGYDDIGLLCQYIENVPGQMNEKRAQADLLRDIFGNPFRPVIFDPAWRTETALALARGIYDERAFDRLPILADALQDARCNADDLLNHLREPNATHVRGCWALDLVLGRD